MTIRRVPADFVVEEQLRPEFSGAIGPTGRVAVYRLTKTSVTTPEAIAGFAKAVGVKPGGVGYGGLKDKHAVTVQHVSAAVAPARAAKQIEGRGWSAALVGWTVDGVTTRAVAANRFTIVVRDLSREAAREMERRAALLSAGDDRDRLLVVNYFGDQRFGSARHGEGFAAARLLKGDFEGALKLLIGTPARKDSGKRRTLTRVLAGAWGRWAEVLERVPRCPERAAVEALARGSDFRAAFGALPYTLQNMCVEAYQSHLWNQIARRLVASSPGALVADDAFGEMVFPVSAEGARWLGAEMPLLGARTVPRAPWGDAASEVLEQEGVTLEDLRIPGLRRPVFDEHPRALLVVTRDFELGPPEPDEMSGGKRVKRAVTFALPPGAFATVVLRALGQ